MIQYFFAVMMVLSAHSAFADSYFGDDASRPTVNPSGRTHKALSSAFDDRSKITPFSKDSHNLAVELGQVFLVGDASRYTDSLGMKLNYTYGVSELLDFESSLAYSSHSDGQYTQVNLLSGVRMNFANYDQMVPYMDAGVGFFHPSKEISDNASFSATLFGLYVGGGLDLKLSREFFFGPNLQLQNAFGTSRETSAGRISLGGASMSFMARAGLTF